MHIVKCPLYYLAATQQSVPEWRNPLGVRLVAGLLLGQGRAAAGAGRVKLLEVLLLLRRLDSPAGSGERGSKLAGEEMVGYDKISRSQLTRALGRPLS